MLETEAFWRTAEGKRASGSSEKTSPKPQGHCVPGRRCLLDTYKWLHQSAEHDLLHIKTSFGGIFNITSHYRYKQLVKINEFIITPSWQ